MGDVALYVGGKIHRGWEQVFINRAINQISGTFSVGMTERLQTNTVPLRIAAGDAVVVKIDGVSVLTGYIDAVDVEYDAASHTINVSGRDKTADLVDCSAASVQFSGQSLEQIAVALCKPFGIEVISETDTIIIDSVKTEESETVFDMLEKLARANNVLLTSNADGNLLITQGGKGQLAGALQLGKNIKSGSGSYDFSDRYSIYIGKGSIAGNDIDFANKAAQVTGNAVDAGVTRYRPLVILPEQALSTQQIVKRVNWEANNRAANAAYFDYVTVGWTNEKGGLWQTNDLVNVIDPFMGLNQLMLISAVSFSIDEGGFLTTLTLVAQGSFTADPTPEVVKIKKTKSSLLPDFFLQ